MGQRLARGEPEHRAFDLPAEQGGQAVVDRPGLPAEIVQPLKLREMVLLKLAQPFVQPVKGKVVGGKDEHIRRQLLEPFDARKPVRSEEHTSELQSLMRISYAVFCLKTKKQTRLRVQQTNGHTKQH